MAVGSRFEMRQERVSGRPLRLRGSSKASQARSKPATTGNSIQILSPIFTFGLLPILPSHPWPSVAEFITRGKMTLRGSSLRWRSGPRPRGSTGVKTRLQTGKAGRGRIEMASMASRAHAVSCSGGQGDGIGGPEGAYPRSGDRSQQHITSIATPLVAAQ